MTIRYGCEDFTAKGFAMKQKNFLLIFTFQNVFENTIPDFDLYSEMQVLNSKMDTDKTTPPSLLNETDLISLMDKNGIGTDATIHEHISKIQHRNFAVCQNKLFRTTQLGLALVIGYKLMGHEFDLTSPHLRAWMEVEMKTVEHGQQTKQEVTQRIVQRLMLMYRNMTAKSHLIIEAYNGITRNEDE